MKFILLQPVREAVSYRGLFTAGWFGVREKYCSRLEIYDRLQTSEQAEPSEFVVYSSLVKKPTPWTNEPSIWVDREKCSEEQHVYVDGMVCRNSFSSPLAITYLAQVDGRIQALPTVVHQVTP